MVEGSKSSTKVVEEVRDSNFGEVSKIILLLLFFFNVGPHKEDIFSGHFLSPIFQSSFTCYNYISCLGSCTRLLIRTYNTRLWC